MHKKESTKDRILATSFKLFLQQGYSSTGLNQIVEEASTVKASLYQYYNSKEELGRDVLRTYSNNRLELLNTLMLKYPYPLDFVRSWVKILNREAIRSELHGCGMANFRAQITEKDTLILEEIKSIVKVTISRIEEYLEKSMHMKFLKSNSPIKELSQELFYSYEGCLQGYRLLGDRKALNGLYDLAEKILANFIKPKNTI
jgi:TetR/AcrR family transcriptional repressor of lmrAB and yxaGH operons